jgi:ParB-like chromosome segregation protein Spo0J
VTTTDAGATTAPAAGPTGRPGELLAAIRRQRGRWNTARVVRLYRRLGVAVPPERLRAIARGDLRDLHAWGHLTLHDQPSNKHYTLTRGESS